MDNAFFLGFSFYRSFFDLKNLFKKKYWPTVKAMQTTMVIRLKNSTLLCAASVFQTSVSSDNNTATSAVSAQT